jgi:hypothetical protein
MRQKQRKLLRSFPHFGNPARSSRFDLRWLCGPSSRWVCLYRFKVKSSNNGGCCFKPL